MSHGYVFILLCYIADRFYIIKVVYMHIGVRLRVARFDDMGNARALKHEASNRCMASRFFTVYNIR